MHFCGFLLDLFISIGELPGKRGKRKEEKDRPLPPLLARVGGNIEVKYLHLCCFLLF